MGSWLRDFLRWTSIGLLLTLAAGTAVLANDDLEIQTPVVTPTDATNDGRLRGTDLGKMIETAIGKDNYQQVTVILGTCHSGAGLGPIAGGLGGPHNVIASCGAGQTTVTTQNTKTKAITGVIPGLFDKVIADPTTSVDGALDAGAASSDRTPKGTTAAERAAWEADQQKRYEANRAARQRAAQAALDKAKAEGAPADRITRLTKLLEDANKRPDWDKGGRDLWVEEPASQQSADKPGAKKLGAGTTSNHAIVYQAYPTDSFDAETKVAVAGLKAAGYTVDVLTPLRKADYDKLKEQSDAGQPLGVPADRATPDNLKRKLEALRAVMTPTEALAVVIVTHGGRTLDSARSDAGTGAGGGAVFRAADRLDRIDDPLLASLLIEEAISPVLGEALADYPYFRRWEQPSLMIRTASEIGASGLPVTVLANGVALGTMTLDAPTGALHVLPFSDALIDALLAETDLGAGLALSFEFAGLLDSFTLATAEDMAGRSDDLGRHGIALAVHLDGGLDVPAPGGTTLLPALLACLAATRFGRGKG